MRAMLEVSTDYGYDVAIYEEDLEGITASGLWKLRMSRPVSKGASPKGDADAGQDRERTGYGPAPTEFRRQAIGHPFGRSRAE